MARKRKFYWYQAQLLFAAFLQFLAIFAPLSYAGNFSQHKTAFLHAFWVSEETVDFANRTTSLDLIWFFPYVGSSTLGAVKKIVSYITLMCERSVVISIAILKNLG